MNKVYGIITDEIIRLLESGVVPWRRPWSTIYPQNLVSRKEYRGINVFMLYASAMMQGFRSPFWLSFKQARALGGSVRQGEASTIVIFWKMKFREFATDELDDVGNPVVETKPAPVLRYYRVFNLEQCDLPEDEIPAQPEGNGISPIDRAEQIIENCPDPPAERTFEGRAWYSSELDTIGIPPMERFESAEKFYCTRFHEYGHATGHPRRLHRFDIADCSDIFGSESYSKEELVAELTAAFLCAQAGIDNTLEHSASYLQGWLKRLREDRKLIVIAAASAQKAADYILGRTFSDSISVAGCDPA